MILTNPCPTAARLTSRVKSYRPQCPTFGLLHSSGNAISGSFPAYQVYCGVDDCFVCFNSTQLSGSNPLPYARCSLQEASKPKESNSFAPYAAESEQKHRFYLRVRPAPSIRGPSQVVSSRSGNNPTSCGYERANRFPFVHQQMRKVFQAK